MDYAGCRIDERLDPGRLVPALRRADNGRTIAFAEFHQPRGLSVEGLAADAARREPVAEARLKQVECKGRNVDSARQQVVAEVESRVLFGDPCGLTRGAAFEEGSERGATW